MQYTNRVKPTVWLFTPISSPLTTIFRNGRRVLCQRCFKTRIACKCSHETVRYAGWKNFIHVLEVASRISPMILVMRPLSGRLSSITTVGRFAPDKTLFPQLKQLLEFNFPGLTIHALYKDDQSLKDGVQACREYSMKYRGMNKNELQPARMGVSESSNNERQGGNREEMRMMMFLGRKGENWIKWRCDFGCGQSQCGYYRSDQVLSSICTTTFLRN